VKRYFSKKYIIQIIFMSLYGLVKYIPSPLGEPLRFLFFWPFAKKLKSIWIRDGVTIWYPWGISIGKGVSLNEFVFLNGYGGVEIGDHCRIAHGCSFISEGHRFDDLEQSIKEQGRTTGRIVIGQDTWLGSGVKVLQGVSIGEGCVIGAGSVVNKSIPPFSVAAGVPAKVIRSRGPSERS
jgi:acetyltransferase-like isoleucine patch superfamily enzyme